MLQAAGGKAERRLGSDYTDLLADPAVRQAALLLLKEKVAAGSAPHRKRSASDVAIVRYSKSLARALGRAVVPLAYDLRTVGGFPRVSSVKDQGYCGSCVSFAAMAALESVMLVKSKGKLGDGVLSGSVSPDLSESNTFFCKWPGATCDTGYYLEDAAPLIASKGVIYEDCAPYTGAAPSPVCSTSCSRAPSGKFAATPLGNSIDDIKAHVYTYGAVMTSMAIYQDFMDWANGPACAGSVWRGTSKTGDPTGGHAVTIVGWEEDANGVGNWIVKNSWGDSWCDGGYFRIGYGADAFAGSGDTQGFSWTPAATDCTAQGLIRCGDGSCKSTASQCTVKPDPVCPTGQYKCPDGTCKTSALLCKSACPAGQVQCWNGKCRNNYRECIRDFSNRTVCSQYGLFTCLDGLCAPDPDVCRATWWVACVSGYLPPRQ